MPVNGSTSAVRLSATLTDFGTVSTVVKGEAFIDTLGATGAGISMQAADGAFSTPTENVYLDIPLATVRQMTDGPHTLYVRGKDAAGNWGVAGSTVLTVDKTGPAIAGLSLTPNPTNGAAAVTLTGTVTDAQSTVSSVEWFVGQGPRRRQRHGDHARNRRGHRGRHPHGRSARGHCDGHGARPRLARQLVVGGARRSRSCARCGSRRRATPTRRAWPGPPTTRTSTAGAARRSPASIDMSCRAVLRALGARTSTASAG